MISKDKTKAVLAYKYNLKTSREGASKRKFNIDVFSNLYRSGNLKHGIIERRLLLYTTFNKEKIYIQYPGKETQRINGERPWDFRPKLLDKNGKFLPDLSFANIWDDLSEIHEIDSEILEVIAALFYRMSFMLESECVEEDYSFYDFNIVKEKAENEGVIGLKWNKLIIPREILDILVQEIRGVSWEAYLIYNDLLAQNEDCKYYYRDVIEKGKRWKHSIGRPSMFLTHASVIQFLKKEIKFSEIMNRFQRQRGVAPIPLKSLEEVTGGIIKKDD